MVIIFCFLITKGKTKLWLKVKKNTNSNVQKEEYLDVIVTRKQSIIDKIFTISVATVVAIIYINFGCALQWSELPTNFQKAIGPLIGMTGQFIVMPLVSI